MGQTCDELTQILTRYALHWKAIPDQAWPQANTAVQINAAHTPLADDGSTLDLVFA